VDERRCRFVNRVRFAEARDIDALVWIESSAFEASQRASRRSLRRALASPWQIVQVLERDGRVVAYTILWPYRHTWRLYSIASDPACQGQGFGTRLLEAAVAAARAAGARWLQLEARPDRTLLGWYRQHGFVELQRLADYYAPGEDAVRMRRAL